MPVKLNSSGGGSVTLDVPNTASNVALTVPARAGSVAVDGPAFSAYQSSAQSITANTWTKINFQTKEFDTASCFDSTTNMRFTPTVAGYYQINAAFVSAPTRTYNIISIYRNGVDYKRGQAGNGTTGLGTNVAALVYFNGTTDYIEIYGLSGVTQTLSNSINETYFQAVMVRAA